MDIKILATGLGWMGSGIESIHSNYEEIIENAKYEILLSAFNISSGAMDVFQQLEAPLIKGVDIKILINKFDKHHSSIKSRIMYMLRNYLNFSVYDFLHPEQYDLHAKFIVIDREVAIVGSSNISRRGFFDNHELAIMFSGDQVSKVANAFEMLSLGSFTRKVQP